MGQSFAQPNPRPMFPNPPGLLRLEPYSEGLRDRIWWGAGSNATAVWAARLGRNRYETTERDEPFKGAEVSRKSVAALIVESFAI